MIGLALALGGGDVAGVREVARTCALRAEPVSDASVAGCREAIRRGEDPLGDALCAIRSPATRRAAGATNTPAAIVDAMTAWAASGSPARVVDPGAGSGRFVVAAARAIPGVEIVAVEIDPVAALLAAAHLAAAGFAHRARVVVADYRAAALGAEATAGPTLFLGNPPYVRHHGIDPVWKRWLVDAARSLGLRASQLAGLHAHFFLATALHGRPGDYGAFVTAAEWLDVNYGRLVRELFLGPLGGTSLHVIEPTALPFADAATTAAIACFELGTRRDRIAIRRVASVRALAPLLPDGDARVSSGGSLVSSGESLVRREALAAAPRWTPLTRARRERRAGFVELGELCRVHRGQVTGANGVWIAGAHSRGLPDEVLFRAVTKARELFAAGPELADTALLRRVIDIPADIDHLSREARPAVARFLHLARAMGADRGFIAEHRRAWWAVGLRAPAPILATYMARRPPAFVRNRASARHINIAHGLYPRDPMPPALLDALARFLATSTSIEDGRTYAGGLTKFEPKEMERVLVPEPGLLASS